jgi:hypothetical protein
MRYRVTGDNLIVICILAGAAVWTFLMIFAAILWIN